MSVSVFFLLVPLSHFSYVWVFTLLPLIGGVILSDDLYAVYVNIVCLML